MRAISCPSCSPTLPGCLSETPAVEAAAATLIHTDVTDWAEVVGEAARVLSRGGRFAYVGVHPCFVGPFAKRWEGEMHLHRGYQERGLTYTGPGMGEGIDRASGFTTGPSRTCSCPCRPSA